MPKSTKSCKYVLNQGVLKTERKGRSLVVVPSHLRRTVVREFHEEISLHGGVTKTLHSILQKYCFKGITRYVKSFVKSCKKCAMHKQPGNNFKPGFLKAINATSCLEVLTADILGPITLNDELGRPHSFHVHIIVDIFFSKFLYTKLDRDTKTESIIACFEDVFNITGLFSKIYSNQAPYYTSALFAEFVKNRNIELIMPPANCAFVLGQAGSLVKDVKLRLRFALSTHKAEWVKELAKLTLAINSSFKESLQTSSFEIVHGFLPRTKLDNVVGCQTPKSACALKESCDKLRGSALDSLNKHRGRYIFNADSGMTLRIVPAKWFIFLRDIVFQVK